MQEKNTIEQMKLIINEREKRVRELEEELKQLKETLYANFNNNVNTTNNNTENESFFLLLNKDAVDNTNKEGESQFVKARPMSSSRPTTATTAYRTDSMLDREISSSRLNFKNNTTSATTKPSHNNSHHQRPSSTNSLVNAKSAIEQKKQNQVELKLENCELKTLYKTSECERLRLLELVKSQQKRIEELNEKALENENRLNEQRRRCAALEKQVEKLKLTDTKGASSM